LTISNSSNSLLTNFNVIVIFNGKHLKYQYKNMRLHENLGFNYNDICVVVQI